MKEVLSWFGTNLMVSFKDITQNMFCNSAKSHTQLTMKFTISSWSLLLSYNDDTLRVLCDMLLKIAP